jgi:FkbM family methyltransferase
MMATRLPWWRCLPAWPFLWYTRWEGAPLGRRFLGISVVPRLLPKAGRFDFRHRNGVVLELEYGDSLGFLAYIFGGFEPVELAALMARLNPGDTALDVGANIGFHTTALAAAVGPSGKVFAVEPVPDNAARLRSNLARNNLTHVQIYEVASGASTGEIELELTRDPAFVSAHGAVGGGPVGRRLKVPLARIDDLWRSAGSPRVKVMKLDTEGAELDGLNGAEEMIRACRPAILLEANDEARLAVLDQWLLPRGYRRTQPEGFEVWNFLYEATEPVRPGA